MQTVMGPCLLLLALAAGAMATSCAELRARTVFVPEQDARLGGLFDPYTHTFAPRTFWPQTALEQNTIVDRISQTESQVAFDLTWEAKAELLDMDAEARAAVLSGAVALQGGTAFLDRVPQQQDTMEVTLLFRVSTQHEYLREELLREPVVGSPHYARPHLRVVTALRRGVHVAVTLFYDRAPGDATADVQARFRDLLNQLLAAGDDDAAPALTPAQAAMLERTSMVVDADLAFSRAITGAGAIRSALRALEQDLQRALGQAGLPLYAVLEPMCRWQRSGEQTAAVATAAIDPDDVSALAGAVQAMAEQTAWANTLRTAAADALGLARAERELERLTAAMAAFRRDLQAELAAVLPDVRAGIRTPSAVRAVLQRLARSPFNAAVLHDWLERKAQEIAFVQRLIGELPPAVGRAAVFGDATHPHQDAHAVVLLVFVPGSDSTQAHLQALEQYAAAPGDGFPAVLPADPDSWVHAGGTGQLRGHVAWIKDIVAQHRCVATPDDFVCDPDHQLVAVIDYHANRAVLDALLRPLEPDAGELRDSRIFLLHERRDDAAHILRLLNGNLQRCASPCDPRDERAMCLYPYGSVPNGCECAAPAAAPDFLDDMCQSGVCRENQCGGACVPALPHCDSDCLAQAQAVTARARAELGAAVAEYDAAVQAAVQNHTGELKVITDTLLTDVTAYHELKVQACDYFLGAPWTNIELGPGLNGDLNQGSGGWYIFLCQAHNAKATRYVTEIYVTLDQKCPAGTTMMLFHDGHAHHLNAAAGGADPYLCLEYKTIEQAAADEMWPITHLRIQQTWNDPQPGFDLAPWIEGSNGDLAQDAGGRYKYLFYRRTRDLQGQLARHALTLSRLRTTHQLRIAALNTSLAAAQAAEVQAATGATTRFCGLGSRPNPVASQAASCPCVRDDPCQGFGANATVGDGPCPGYDLDHTSCRVDVVAQQPVCECLPGWTGAGCATPIDYCALQPCAAASEYCVPIHDLAGSPMGRQCQLLTPCAPGLFQAVAPTTTSDRQCSACPAGTFQPRYGFTGAACQAHAVTSCGCGQRFVAPSATQDGECLPCPPLEFQPADNHTLGTCVPVTDCVGLEALDRCTDIVCDLTQEQINGGGGSGSSSSVDLSNAWTVATIVLAVLVLILLVVLVVVAVRRRRQPDRTAPAAGYATAMSNPMYNPNPTGAPIYDKLRDPDSEA